MCICMVSAKSRKLQTREQHYVLSIIVDGYVEYGSFIENSQPYKPDDYVPSTFVLEGAIITRLSIKILGSIIHLIPSGCSMGSLGGLPHPWLRSWYPSERVDRTDSTACQETQVAFFPMISLSMLGINTIKCFIAIPTLNTYYEMNTQAVFVYCFTKIISINKTSFLTTQWTTQMDYWNYHILIRINLGFIVNQSSIIQTKHSRTWSLVSMCAFQRRYNRLKTISTHNVLILFSLYIEIINWQNCIHDQLNVGEWQKQLFEGNASTKHSMSR